jgi:hypothetical protein
MFRRRHFYYSRNSLIKKGRLLYQDEAKPFYLKFGFACPDNALGFVLR